MGEAGEGALVAEGTNKDGISSSSSSKSKEDTSARAKTGARASAGTNWLLWDCLLRGRETSEDWCGLEVTGRDGCGCGGCSGSFAEVMDIAGRGD